MIAMDTTRIAIAVVLGGGFGLGVVLLLSLAPRWGAHSLSHRIAPYIRDVADVPGFGPAVAAMPSTAGAGLRALADRAGHLLGGTESLERRLNQAGCTVDAATFRARQLGWGIGGLGAGAVAAVMLALLGRSSGALVLLAPIAALTFALLFDAHLTRAARARIAQIEEELPTVLEFLALCLSAGEGILDSLRRVGEVGAGELTGELRGVVLAVSTGSSLSGALSRLAARLEISALSRAVDQVVAAIDRGAPLADVLHAQALDAREDAKRSLIEQAGRKEIWMLFPLVFLILPLSILFAVFPGVFMLRLGIV